MMRDVPTSGCTAHPLVDTGHLANHTATGR